MRFLFTIFFSFVQTQIKCRSKNFCAFVFSKIINAGGTLSSCSSLLHSPISTSESICFTWNVMKSILALRKGSSIEKAITPPPKLASFKWFPWFEWSEIFNLSVFYVIVFFFLLFHTSHIFIIFYANPFIYRGILTYGTHYRLTGHLIQRVLKSYEGIVLTLSIYTYSPRAATCLAAG